MEGVPRVSMISFPMRKSAENPNFKNKLKAFIRDHYTEDGESYSTEINDLESLRAGAIHVSKDFSGCSTLKKYFCQLNFLKSRFPLHEGGLCAVSFSWYDVFSEIVHGWSDIDFEMSVILYNIGALHSELGATDNRQSADGMKNACTHFQCSAWAFQHLRHNYPKFFTPDVSPDTLSIMTNVCLAQAQECILEKSLIDNRKSTITAKVALQIVEYYQLSLKTSDQFLKDGGQYSDKAVKAVKKWRKLIELKIHYYECISFLYRGMQAEDENKWGERVTFYKASLEKLTEAFKSAKSLEKTDNIHDTLQFTFDVVQGKVALSEKDNEFIYHEKVPEISAIASDIKGVSLVKGIPFKFDDPQIAGQDIFGRLVPMEAHEASSLYSEEKAKVLRNYSSKIEAKNETLDKLIIALQLEQLDLHSASTKVPQELVDCCAALSVNQDAVKKLSDSMSKLSGMFHDVVGNLEEIEQLLNEDEIKAKDIQKILGNRPTTNVVSELSKELHRLKDAHTVAAETNNTLHEALSKHVGNLNILLKPFNEVMTYIPSLEEDGDMDAEAITQMKRLIGKVDEMRKQRIMLEQQLRDSIHSDDITKQLVIKKDQDLEQVFQEELQKHDKITQILDQNLLAQENIIRALTEANANYAETRKQTVQLMKRRDKVIDDLLSSYEAYDELLGKVNKGIEFYSKLDGNVQKLLQRTRAVCKVQEEERESAMKALIQKGSHLNTNPLNFNKGSYMPSPNSTLPMRMPTDVPLINPSGGGHLKLKDVLAMKKSGGMPQQQPAATATQPQFSNGMSANPQPQPTPQQFMDPQLHQQAAYSNYQQIPTTVCPNPNTFNNVGSSHGQPQFSTPSLHGINYATPPVEQFYPQQSTKYQHPQSNFQQPQQKSVNSQNQPNPNNYLHHHNQYTSSNGGAVQSGHLTTQIPTSVNNYSSANQNQNGSIQNPIYPTRPQASFVPQPQQEFNRTHIPPNNYYSNQQSIPQSQQVPPAHVQPQQQHQFNPNSTYYPPAAPTNIISQQPEFKNSQTATQNLGYPIPLNSSGYQSNQHQPHQQYTSTSSSSNNSYPIQTVSYQVGYPSSNTSNTNNPIPQQEAPKMPQAEYNVNEGFLAKYVKQHLGNTPVSTMGGVASNNSPNVGPSYLIGSYGTTTVPTSAFPMQQHTNDSVGSSGQWYQQQTTTPSSAFGYNNSQIPNPQQNQGYSGVFSQGQQNTQEYTQQSQTQNQQEYWQHNQGQRYYNGQPPPTNNSQNVHGPPSNIDLLSGIDLNAPPAMEPLRPNIAGSANYGEKE